MVPPQATKSEAVDFDGMLEVTRRELIEGVLDKGVFKEL